MFCVIMQPYTDTFVGTFSHIIEKTIKKKRVESFDKWNFLKSSKIGYLRLIIFSSFSKSDS